ncbi:OmpL47-type beta-barrel domain-containing protein [Paenisporosarcina indica]|uniref:OmpL47-type beta-barrel domain-containing protein n=1 Tax=Paenisporosarcina indica TaxID=650093 RepID=UPI00094F662C|nr:hypothetical protein [Paenisporosarcina indica]
MKKYSHISLLLSILLVLQLVLPAISVFATSIEAPTDLKVTVNSGNNFLLKWTGVSSAQKYNVYQVVNGEKKLIGSPEYPSFNFANKPEGEYVFEVTAFKTASGESAPSNQVAYTLEHPQMLAPQDLSLTVRNGNDLALKWTVSEFASSYNIYQIKDSEKKLVFNTANLNRTFSNMPEGKYVYEVTAVSDRFGESQTASQIETNLVHPVMAAPADLTLSIRNGNDINLKWPEVAFATAYNIYEIKNGVKKLVNTTENLTRTLTNRPTGDYQYEVYSVSSRFGESKTGVQSSTTLVHPDMSAPLGLSTSVRNGNDLFVKWTEVEFATGYNIYQIKDGVKKFLYNTENTSRTFANLPAGDYQYEVTSVSDRFGESQKGSQVKYSLVHPVMASPENLRITVQNGNDLLLKWTQVEFATSYNIYQIKEGKKELVSNTPNLSRTFTNMPEDWYEYEVTAVSDRFGESEVSYAQVTLGHPVVASPVLELQSINDNVATLKWNEIPNASLYHIFEVIDGEFVLLDSTDKKTFTVNGIEDGKHEFVVTVTHNRFGDSRYSNVIAVEIQNDRTPPTTTTNVGNVWQKQDFTVELTAEDNKSGVASTFYSVNGSDYKEGTSFTLNNEGINKISFYSIDNAGNIEEAKTAEVKIDLSAPETTSNTTGDWHQEFTVELTANDLSGVFATYYSVNGSEYVEGNSFIVNEEGLNVISFYSVDNAGNKEEPKTAEVRIDQSAPETTSNMTNQWYQEFTVELTAIDKKIGVDKTFYSINGSEYVEGNSFTINEEGVNIISFFSVDNAGNKEEPKSAEVKIDQSAPETTSNATDEWNQEFTVELTAKDVQSGVSATYYSVNGSEYIEGTNFTVNEEGINEISFYSVDKAGNEEEAKTAEVKIDQSAPETTSNATDEWHQEFTVELTAKDDQSGISATYYSVNESEYIEGTNFTVNEEGINEVSFYSVDKAGNVEEAKTAEVKIDQSAPETTSNATDEWHQELTVELTAKDDQSGVSATYYSVNGSEYAEGTSITLSEEGINKVSFFSVDNAGNIEEAKTVEVKIDHTAPETASNYAEHWSQNKVAVELAAKDDQSGVKTTYYSVNGSEFAEGISFTVNEEGINKVSFYSVDQAGNKEEVKTIEVKIDQTAPTVTWELKDLYSLGTKLPLTYMAKDAVSGLKAESLTVNGKSYTNGDSISFNQPGKYNVQITVTDNAGWTTTLKKTIEVYIPVTSIKVNPGVIKDNDGVFSVEVSLPKGFDTKNFILESVSINGVAAISGKNGYEKQAEKGQFKFNREDFDWNDGKQTLEFSGMLGNYLVVGSTTVEVKGSKKQDSNNGHHHRFSLWELIIYWILRGVGN